MDWQDHMKRVAVNWLSKGDLSISMEPKMLMLFGNPDLLNEDQLLSRFESVAPVGVLYRGIYSGKAPTLCRPLFGAPIVAMYLEVAVLLGVKKIVACGYVGGVLRDIDVGSYVILSSAYGLDGCTQNYSPKDPCCLSSESLTSRLCQFSNLRGARYAVGSMVSIDTPMLEDDAMISDFKNKGYLAVDLGTACLYAVGTRLGLEVASIHIVSDSPGQKEEDKGLLHEASFAEQVDIALHAPVRN